jgi:DNA polymerase
MSYRNARVEPLVPAYCRSLGLPERAKPTLVFDHPAAPGTATYGGELVENIVQAICRDLLASALVECERQGLPVVLHVHDEIVVEAATQQAEEALRRLVEILSTPPAWAAGFPVEVEGFSAERYFKAPPRGTPKIKARNGQIRSTIVRS